MIPCRAKGCLTKLIRNLARTACLRRNRGRAKHKRDAEYQSHKELPSKRAPKERSKTSKKVHTWKKYTTSKKDALLAKLCYDSFIMEHPPSPDLLGKTAPNLSRQTWWIASLFAVAVAMGAAVGARWSYLSNHASPEVLAAQEQTPFFGGMRKWLFGSQAPAGMAGKQDPAEDKRLTVLFLGIGGPGHEGSNLTDSILLTSIDLETKKVGILSLPRDLAYPLDGGRFEKINAVHAYAEQQAPGEGAIRTAHAFSELLEVPIDHVVRVDFRGFVKFIDALGGITVNVETSFTDTTYPSSSPPNSWKTVSFKKGVQTMDGERALIYARSRHGNNGEGSDFGRSRRQQLVMLAVREKLLSLNTLSDPGKLADMYRVVSSHVQTNLSVWDMLAFAPLARDFEPQNITMNVLTDAPDGLLTSGNVGGAYMLFPKQRDWSEIRAIAQNPYTSAEARAEQKQPQETVKLEIKNGTFKTNFAAQVAAKLEQNGYEIGTLGNAGKRGFERTAIYDLTGGKKPAELLRLQKELRADIVTLTPEQLTAGNAGSYRTFLLDTNTQERVYSQTTDFVLILGEASFAFVDQR